ncbi:MAG: nucleotidyltransferase domain-containing protein [Bifidobacteriaceae bacterium]|jgi:predicted nucleotidyltransferase|nr:nucleotidyltransferase domain-containing protein [Bifidobacteriaceae bacterium]
MRFGLDFGGLIPGAKGSVLAVLLRTGKPMSGRHIGGMIGQRHSLWAVQTALKELAATGLVEAETYGNSTLHKLNEQHIWVPLLRAMASPVESLRQVVAEASAGAGSVILFGSIARGEAQPGSDVDLAVIAPAGWDGALHLQDAVWERLGNACDVLVFTESEFLAKAAFEPVVADIIRDGIPLAGAVPRLRVRA